MISAEPNGQPAQRPWLFPALLVVVLLLLLLWRQFPPSEQQSPPPAETNVTGRVSVGLEPGEGSRRELTIPLNRGTALSALLAAGGESPAFVPEVDGRGSSALVTAIGGIRNEGGEGRNWIYSINGRPGDRSAGVAEVRAGDRVLWRFVPAE